jgi:hypothetical protein
MIHCPRCDIHYSPSHTTCPSCNSFQTPREVHLNYLKARAEEQLQDGDDPAAVRGALIKTGVSDLDADDVLRKGLASMRRENRRHGVVRLVAGIPMVLAGLAVVACGMYSLRKDSSIQLSGRIAALVLGSGGFLLVTGLLASVSGGYALLTGKDSGIRPLIEKAPRDQ